MPLVFEKTKVISSFNSALQQVPDFNNIQKRCHQSTVMQMLQLSFYCYRVIKLLNRRLELTIQLKINKFSLCMMLIDSLIHWILFKKEKKQSRLKLSALRENIEKPVRLFLIQSTQKDKTNLQAFLKSLQEMGFI